MGKTEATNQPEKKTTTKKLKGRYKTVQQLALEYGMTKNGIMARLNKMLKEVQENNLDENDYVSRGAKNTIYVLEPGLIWLARFNDENSPMQAPAPNKEIELYKEQLEELKENIKELRAELVARDNQITGLIAATAQQAKTIETQNNQLIALTTKNAKVNNTNPETDPDTIEAEIKEPETAKTAPTEDKPSENTETPPQKAPEGAETPVSISDDELRAELKKLSFWGRFKRIFLES